MKGSGGFVSVASEAEGRLLCGQRSKSLCCCPRFAVRSWGCSLQYSLLFQLYPLVEARQRADSCGPILLPWARLGMAEWHRSLSKEFSVLWQGSDTAEKGYGGAGSRGSVTEEGTATLTTVDGCVKRTIVLGTKVVNDVWKRETPATRC